MAMTGAFKANLTPTRLTNNCCVTPDEELVLALYANYIFTGLKIQP